MAINVLRGLRDRTARTFARPPGPTDAIGGFEDYDPPAEAGPRGPHVGCSVCGQSLGILQTRCPGCGSHVLAGVPVKRGGLLVVAGCAGGLVIGLGLAIGLAMIQAPAQAAGPGPAASAAAGASADPSADPALVSGPVPRPAGAALRQVANVEDRMIGSAAVLRAQVKLKSFSAATAARTIRAIAADAAWGSDIVDQLAGWPAAAPLRAQLSAAYAAYRTVARDALSVSLQDDAKYKAAAKTMIKVLASVPDTRKAIDALAAANGITIPAPITAP